MNLKKYPILPKPKAYFVRSNLSSITSAWLKTTKNDNHI